MIGFVIGLLLRLLFGGCLLYACVTDIRTCEVYNFTWWLAGAAAIGRFLLRGGVDATVLPELVFFCMVQLLCFTRLYGKADCYAFCVCAAALASEGGGLLEFVLQMALAFCMLAFVQLLRRNIDRRGNLKQPVPFVPYIALSFVLLVFYRALCKTAGSLHLFFLF